MGAFAGLINMARGNQQTAGASLTAGQSLSGKGANPLAAATAGTSSTNSAGSSSATISANDFLTLLVTEMQNQDPTADTDPNEYINQLVQVNSLEQLIDINQNLSTALGIPSAPSGNSAGLSGAGATGATGGGSSSATAGPGVVAGHTGAKKTVQAALSPGVKVNSPGSNVTAAISKFTQSAGRKGVPGNLSIPAAQPAAQRVARSLDGHPHPASSRSRNPGTAPIPQ